MITELITPPTVEPFSLTDLKTALRIDHSHEDDLVMRLGVTARTFIERRLSHAVAEQTWKSIVNRQLDAPIPLRPGRVTSVDEVQLTYGEAEPFLSTDWKLVANVPSHLVLSAPLSNADGCLESVEVTFRSGRSDVTKTPPDLVEAIFALTAHYYENREAVLEGRYVSLPLRVESLVSGLREVRL